MQLELSLGNQFIWALVHPTAREHVKITNGEPGYQDINLMFSQSYPGPVKVHMEDFPVWAQVQIKTAVKSGQLINTGDKIDAVIEPSKSDKSVETEAKPAAKRAKKN